MPERNTVVLAGEYEQDAPEVIEHFLDLYKDNELTLVLPRHKNTKLYKYSINGKPKLPAKPIVDMYDYILPFSNGARLRKDWEGEVKQLHQQHPLHYVEMGNSELLILLKAYLDFERVGEEDTEERNVDILLELVLPKLKASILQRPDLQVLSQESLYKHIYITTAKC